LGFGAAPAAIDARHSCVTFAVAVLVTVVGIAFGDRGL
jgi:hypothetical protein